MTDLVVTSPPFSLYQFPNKTSTHRLMIIGEAPGEEEDRIKVPFAGMSGELLNQLLRQSGFERGVIREKGKLPFYYSEFHVTNVFATRPPDNDLKLWTRTKTELKQMGLSDVGRLPPINKRYLLPQYEPEVKRLHAEIAEIKPDLIIALGGTALWALTGDSRITMNRGTFFTPRDITQAACSYFPTRAIASFHPAAILRQWDNLPVLWADLSKARRLLNGTLEPPIARKFWINPTLEEIEHVYKLFAKRPCDPLDPMGVDIETDPRIDQITTISYGFADEAICIPFYDKYAMPDKCNYWHSATAEAIAWGWVKRFGQLPHRKVGQNFLYDHQYLLKDLDVRVQMSDDTAIMQHSMQPELPKALAFLASVYLNEPSWKFMRESTKDDNKVDD